LNGLAPKTGSPAWTIAASLPQSPKRGIVYSFNGDTRAFEQEDSPDLKIYSLRERNRRSAFQGDADDKERDGTVFADHFQRNELVIRMRIVPGPVE